MAKINITADTVKESLERLLAENIIDQEGFDSIFWYFNHCRLNDWSQERATSEIKRTSWTTLYRVFQGTYEASYDSVIQAINRVKIITEQRSKLATIDYIETSTWSTVRDVLDNALIGQEISTINGNSQIGKTAAIEHYISVNPKRRIVYLRMPSAPNKSLFFDSLARACFMAGNTSANIQRAAIINHIDDRTLLVIDEAHQIFLSSERSAVEILEFIRELFDLTKCGVVLCGTDVLKTELTLGKQSKVYKQLVMRGLIHAQLPAKTPLDDIKLAASKFDYPREVTTEARKIIAEINDNHGLGVLLKVLKAGATKSKKSNLKPSWDQMVEAWIILQRLAR